MVRGVTSADSTTKRPPPGSLSQAELTNAASEARRRRTETLRQLADGELTLDALLVLAAVDKAVAKITVKRAVAALPGWGDKSAVDACRWARIDPSRQLAFVVSDVHPERADRLRRAIELGPGHRPEIPDGWPMFGRLPWLEDELADD